MMAQKIPVPRWLVGLHSWECDTARAGAGYSVNIMGEKGSCELHGLTWGT